MQQIYLLSLVDQIQGWSTTLPNRSKIKDQTSNRSTVACWRGSWIYKTPIPCSDRVCRDPTTTEAPGAYPWLVRQHTR